MTNPHRRLVPVLLLAFVATAHAQSSVGIAIGPSVPVGITGANDNLGYHISGMAQTLPSDRALGFRFEASYDAFSREGTVQHITERVFAGSANIIARPTRPMRVLPYFVGGFGMYNQGTNPAPVSSSPSTEVGYNVGGGLRFATRGLRAYAEARYHNVMVDGGARFIPITIGLVF